MSMKSPDEKPSLPDSPPPIDDDPPETAEWLDALEYVIAKGGPRRAEYLLTRLHGLRT